MDFSQLILARQSCRAYDPLLPVEREDILACLEAGRMAPSACNAQPYHFTVVTGETAEKLGAATRSMGLNGFTRDVRTYIVLSEAPYNRTAALGAKVKDQDYRTMDLGIAAAYITAMATERGLGSCILGWFEEKAVRELVGCRGPVRLLIALGHSRKGDPLRPKKRKTMEELVDWI